jgi:hypothetical protein
MRYSAFLVVTAIAWSAVAIPALATQKFKTDSVKMAGFEKIKCASCHDGPMRTEANGGKFTGMGQFLLSRHKKEAKPIDVAWLNDYPGPKPQ